MVLDFRPWCNEIPICGYLMYADVPAVSCSVHGSGDREIHEASKEILITHEVTDEKETQEIDMLTR